MQPQTPTPRSNVRRRSSFLHQNSLKGLKNIKTDKNSDQENEDEENINENDIPFASSKSKISNSQTLSRSRRLSTSSKRPIWKKKIAKFLDSAPVLVFMSILTIYALFSSDFQSAFLRTKVDYAFNVIQCILVGIFFLEWVLNIISKVDYTWSFFFWLDLVATVSIVQDIDWVMNPVLGYGSARQKSYKSSVQAAKAMSKVSSASRATRVLRVIRIVRLIRMVKLYKSVVTARENQEKMKKKERELADAMRKGKKDNDNFKKDYPNFLRGIRGSNNSGSHSENKESFNTIETIVNAANQGNDNNNNNVNNNGNNNNENNNANDDNNNVNKENNNEKNDNKNNKGGDNKIVVNNINERENTDKDKGKETEREATEANNLILNSNSNLKGSPTPLTTGENFLQKKEENDININAKVDEKKGNLSKSKESRTSSIGDLDEEDLEKFVKESKISKIISESITQKVIILILVLLICFPLLSDDFYETDTSVVYELIAQIISASYDLFQANNKILSESTLNQTFDSKFPPINITYNGSALYQNPKYNTTRFRYKEVKTVFSANGQVSIVYSILKETKLTGVLNIFQTIFVCIMLSGAAILFENDARNLVLGPLEIMIEIVENVSKDPINAKNVENLQTGVKAMLDQNEEQNQNKDKSEEEENYEVSVIKAAIIKISALLAISFGEAGGEIIKKNITSGQDLNPRLKGKKKTAIFGFCDIRQFEEINLALEEKTILLINDIADIVHSSVDRFGGSTNKNIGESFLNVWKFYNETPVRDKEGNVTMQKKDNLLEIDPSNPMVAITADQSALACLRIIMKINKNFNILNYRQNEEILKRIPDFKLNMGFGLHIGYGIEGAVGSTYKIDASYLSPNVNIAARLETATRQFGLSLLISGPLYNLFSKDMKHICRFIDCVYVKGSEQPLDLYTVDVNLNITPQKNKNIVILSNKDKRKRYADKKDAFQREVELMKSAARLVLQKSSYLEMLETGRNEEFYSIWDEGIAFYKKGDFRNAGNKFKKCLELNKNDGPAKTLLAYFEKCNYKAPDNWIGVRELTSK